MAFKSKIYISGPRMGTNNNMFGIELASLSKKSSKKKSTNSKRKKK